MLSYREMYADEVQRLTEIDGSCFIGSAWRRSKATGVYELREINWEEPGLPNGLHWHQSHFLTTIAGGGRAFGSFDEARLVGYATVEGYVFGAEEGYVLLDQMFVDRKRRGQGIGKALFELCARWAAEIGGRKLYLCAASSEATIAFYTSLGCKPAAKPDPVLQAADELDIQLEYDLKEVKRMNSERINETLCGADCGQCNMRASCGGCAATGGRPFGGECVLAQCCLDKRLDGCGACPELCATKENLMAELNALGIADMPAVTQLYALPGSFVNMEYTLPGGQKAKFLDDHRIYLGTQLQRQGRDHCYGVAADEHMILICEYGENGADAALVCFKRR